MRTVARARGGGGGPTWGCTMIPLLGDTFCVMQPQVSLTSGRTHTRAAPGDDICTVWLELRRLPPIMDFVGSGPGLVSLLA